MFVLDERASKVPCCGAQHIRRNMQTRAYILWEIATGLTEVPEVGELKGPLTTKRFAERAQHQWPSSYDINSICERNCIVVSREIHPFFVEDKYLPFCGNTFEVGALVTIFGFNLVR